MKITISSKSDIEFLELVWSIFFKKKNRGVSLEKHFPWIGLEAGIYYINLWDQDKLIGGLVLKDFCFIENNLLIGAIGLVCIDENYRGRGLFQVLMEHAIGFAKDVRGYDALTLWTRQHTLYARYGFEVLDSSLFGWIENANKCLYSSVDGSIERKSFEDIGIGLPPFAKSGELISDANAQLLVIQNEEGIILCDWKGDDANVFALICSTLPSHFGLNAYKNDSLLEFLKNKNLKVNLINASLQMWCFIKIEKIENLSDLTRFTILQRI